MDLFSCRGIQADKHCKPMQPLAGKDGALCHNTPACHRLLVEFRCLLGPNLRGGGECYSYPVHNNWCHAVECLIIRLFSPVCWALPGWPLVGHLGNFIFYNTMWVAHACILSMLLFCGDHLSLQGVQRVRWMLASFILSMAHVLWRSLSLLGMWLAQRAAPKGWES